VVFRNLLQFDVEAGCVKPLLARVASNHLNSFRLVANAVQLDRLIYCS
jgi:hypothetical protein